MRGLHGQDASDGTDTGTDSGADAPERHAGGHHEPGRAIVEDTETRTALVLAYRQRVEAEPATCGPGDATPQGNQSRHSLATTGTEGEHAFRTPAAENADSRDADHHEEQAQRQDKVGRATRDADVPPSDVDNPEGRRDAARELGGLICDELLARGKVAETRDTAYGPSHRVLSGLTGPNGRHATLVTCWLIEERAGLSVPRLTTADAESIFDGRTIPAGMKGTVLEARSDGSCLAEFAFAPQTADSDGDFVQGILTRDQYEVIES